MSVIENTSKKRLVLIAGIIIALLLATCAVLVYNQITKDEVIVVQAAQIDESERLTKELNDEYQEALAELDAILAENEELRTEIEAEKENLKNEKSKIARLIRQGKTSSAELATARRRIDELIAGQRDFIAQIDNLKKENKELSVRVEQSEAEKTILRSEVEKERVATEKLQQEKAAVIAEKQTLTAEKDELALQVTQAQVVDVADIQVRGYSVRSNGKLRRKRSAKNVELVKINFELTNNELTPEGDEDFFVRLISPTGQTMAVESAGSGVIKSGDGTDIRYSVSETVFYDKQGNEIEIQWNPGISFERGEYTVEVYNKGFLAGSDTFKLR